MSRTPRYASLLGLLAVTLLAPGMIPDARAGGFVTVGLCGKAVLVIAGPLFSGFLIAEQVDDPPSRRVTLTLVVTSETTVPSPTATTQVYTREFPSDLAPPDIATLTDAEIRAMIIGNPFASPPSGLCFESPVEGFFRTTGAVRIRRLVGISPPRVIGGSTFRHAQVRGRVFPRWALEPDP